MPTQAVSDRQAHARFCVSLFAFAGAAAQAAAPQAGTLFSHPANIELEDGNVIGVEAGEVFVPENRATNTGKIISIPYYRLRSTAREAAPPVFVIAGGPGESGINDFSQDAGSRAMALFYREFADVVVFDQRGAGHSRPRLDCPQRMELPLDRPLTREAHVAEVRRKAVLCRDEWQRSGVDLEAYTTIENAADVDTLRRALGYEKINLIGWSYGTHLSIALMRHYPQAIERAILYGVEGPDHTYDMPSQTLAALSSIAAAAERSATLRASIPPGGLMAALASVEERLTKAPVTATVTRDGRNVAVTIGAFDVQRLARDGAYDLTDLTWPARVMDMHRGDFSQLASSVIDLRSERIDGAMYSMMDCASGITPARRARIQTDAEERSAQQVLGDINLDYFAACDIWNSPDLGESFRSDLRSNLPVLIFQGTWDISTPYSNAEEVARGLTGAHLVRVEGGTHATLYDLFDLWPPVRPLIKDFLRGRAIDPPATVALPEANFRAVASDERTPQQ